MTAPTWELVFVMPNLTLPAARAGQAGDGSSGVWSSGLTIQGEDRIAIVPASDERLSQIAEANPQARKLLTGFRTLGGHNHRPSALLVRSDAPPGIRLDLEAITAFRNATAFPFLLRARADGVSNTSSTEPTWSDTFEFYPTTISTTGRLVTHADSLLAGYSEQASFLATHSPHMSPCGDRLYPDWYLWRALGVSWHQRYVLGHRSSPRTRAIFRSLEVAFGASSAATKNQGALSDYGTQMGLWVSAIEILAWPEHKKADFGKVHALLGRYPWRERHLAAPRYRITWRGQRLHCNAVQRAYAYMYFARNRFLHGEAVSVQTLVPGRRGRSLPVPQLAAVVYRTALTTVLLARIKRLRLPSRSLGRESFDQIPYIGALERAFALTDSRSRGA